jgi:hypothetical protein
LENWIADELKASSNDEPGTARYRLSAGDLQDQTKEHLGAMVVGTPSIDRQDELVVLEKCLDTLIRILVDKRNQVQQQIEDRRLAALAKQ